MSNLHDFLNVHVFPKLSERQVRVVMYRQKDVFGFGENTMTYKAIALQESVSAQRIKQIIFKAKCIISNRLRQIGEAQKSPHVIIKKVSEEELNPNLPMRQKFVYDLGELSVRAWNCLKNENLMLIDRLIEKTETEMLRVPHLGKKSLNELRELLNQHDLAFRSEHYTNNQQTG